MLMKEATYHSLAPYSNVLLKDAHTRGPYQCSTVERVIDLAENRGVRHVER